MATERQPPTGEHTVTNLTGSYLDIDDDPDAPDGNWMAATANNVSVSTVVTFDNPTGNPTVGADLQEFKAWAVQFDEGQTGIPDIRLELWENGVLVRAGNDIEVPNGGTLVSLTWNANELGTADGSRVECKLVGTKVGGGGGTRNSVTLGAVEWNVDYASAAADLFAADIYPIGTVAGALTTDITAAAAISASGTVAGALTTAITPKASISASGTVAGVLTTSITAAASISAEATISGTLEAVDLFAASISGTGTVAGAITTSITPAASISASATVAGALTTDITAAAAISAQATVSGTLEELALFAADIDAIGTVAGALSTAITPAAAISASATLAGSIDTDITAAAAISAQASMVGRLVIPGSEEADAFKRGFALGMNLSI